MAPRLKASGKPGAPAAAPGAPDDTQDIAPDVQTFLEQFGDGAATVLLFRREEALGEEAYVGSIPVGGFDLDKVSEKYGGGRYRLQLKDSNRKFIKGSSRVFAIAGPSKNPAGPAPVLVGTLPTAADPLTARLDRLEQVLQRPPADPLETAIKLMGMFKEAIIPHAQTPASEMAAAFREGMQLMRDAGAMSGGRDDDDGDRGYSLVLETVGRPLAKLLERRIDEEAEERRRPPALPVARTAPAAPLPARTPAPAAADTPGADVGVMWWLKLRPYIPKLLRLAKEDRDTYGWARVILEELDDDTVNNLQAVIHNPDLVDTVATVVPKAAAYREWFTRFFEDVATILEDDDAADLEDGAGGDTGGEPASASLEGSSGDTSAPVE